jgi:hypothetical protein
MRCVLKDELLKSSSANQANRKPGKLGDAKKHEHATLSAKRYAKRNS